MIATVGTMDLQTSDLYHSTTNCRRPSTGIDARHPCCGLRNARWPNPSLLNHSLQAIETRISNGVASTLNCIKCRCWMIFHSSAKRDSLLTCDLTYFPLERNQRPWDPGWSNPLSWVKETPSRQKSPFRKCKFKFNI